MRIIKNNNTNKNTTPSYNKEFQMYNKMNDIMSKGFCMDSKHFIKTIELFYHII